MKQLRFLTSPVCLILLFLAPNAWAQQAEPLPQPAIHLDGRLNDGEWEGSAQHSLEGGGQVFLKRTGDALTLAVRGEEFGWSHVYLHRGDSIFVLHASAALGTAVYVPGEKYNWKPVTTFNWAVRDTTFTPEAEAARTAFFNEHGWIANTNRMGTRRVIEFRIANTLIGDAETQWAVVYASDPEAPQYWPPTLHDATLHAELIAGREPEGLHFDPSSWENLDVIP